MIEHYGGYRYDFQDPIRLLRTNYLLSFQVSTLIFCSAWQSCSPSSIFWPQ